MEGGDSNVKQWLKDEGVDSSVPAALKVRCLPGRKAHRAGALARRACCLSSRECSASSTAAQNTGHNRSLRVQ